MTPEEARAAVEWMVDRAVEEAQMAHGWVNRRPDGAIARCGGPVICRECAVEACSTCGRVGLAANAYHAQQERTGGQPCH